MRRVIRSIVFIVIILVVVAGAVYALLPQPTPVTAASVTVGPMHMSVDEEGKTRIRERYIVSSPLTGRLVRITLHPGDQVTAEQTTLAVIEPTAPELLDARAIAGAEARVRAAVAAVGHADATVARARATFEHAATELDRTHGAFKRGAANQRELDEARTLERTGSEELRAAQFGHEIASFELDVARSALLYAHGDTANDAQARMHLHSPINGTVLRVFQESVDVVTPGAELIEVGDPRDLEVVIDVLSTDAVTIRPGNRVTIDHWGGDQPLEGAVRIVEPSAFTKVSALGVEEQRVNVIVEFVSPAADRPTLGDGFRVEAMIVVWEAPEVLQIPTSAAFRDGDRWAVFLIDDGRAALRHIEIGRAHQRSVQVLEGLVIGDRVVLHPGDQLEAGLRIVER